MRAPAAVYAFSSITFTPAGASGREGPTLSQALAYYEGIGSNPWVQDPAFFDVIGNGTQVRRLCVGACQTMHAARKDGSCMFLPSHCCMTCCSCALQVWVVPQTATYAFALAGAAGGGATNYDTAGGAGAALAASVRLARLDLVYLVVGQQGVNALYGGGGGALLPMELSC